MDDPRAAQPEPRRTPRRRRSPETRNAALVAVAVYVVLAIGVVTEKFGLTTSDTRLDLTDAPTAWLRGTFTLWSPRTSLGELQNQAYGYLWPQGPFFAGLHEIGVAGWVSERLWSVLVLVLACEGLRRLAHAVGFRPWAALVAGLAYGLNPRMVAELGVRSAEILPGAMLPWALLPIVLAITGRLRPRAAVLLSAAAFACFGGVNATATGAPAVLLVIVVAWALRRRLLSWRFAAGWTAAMVAAGLWWATSLVILGRYSPPFFDYVEDAPTTTRTAGFAASLRGASNWVDYLTVGGHAWWPGGYLTSFTPGVVLAGGVVSVLGVLGLMAYRGLFRTPLLIGAAVGITALTLAHTGPLGSPLNQVFQDLLDGSLAPLRNVPKADPVLRVPLCLGLAAFVEEIVRVAATRASSFGLRRPVLRRFAALGLVGALGVALAAMSWPIMSAQTRTPGWEAIPDYWHQTADELAHEPAPGAAWIVPGSGFGIQTWGWTMEEPMQVLGDTPWVTRSQVPLTPAPTIRMLSSLEDYLTTGAGSPYLAQMLRRVGIDRVVVRHDLDPQVSQATPSTLVGVAIARSPGLQRVATFGQLAFGPAIEVFEVQDADGSLPGTGETPSRVTVRDTADAVTVASSVEDAIAGVGAGLVGPEQPMVVRGESGWEQPVDVQGDGYRKRERAFGRVDQAESNVMTPADAYRGGRVLPNYPGPPGAQQVTAHYDGIAGVTASSSQGFVDIIGPVRPEDAPWSVVDGDDGTAWVPAPYQDPQGQWVDVDLGSPHTLGTITLQEPSADVGLQPVEEWSVSAGGRTVTARPNPFTGRTTLDLGGVVASDLRITVAAVADHVSPVGLAEVDVPGVTASRTLDVPAVPLADAPDFLFSAAPEARACVTTLLGPDCDLGRQRASEEAPGIDRTITLDHAATLRLRGLAVARSDAASVALLQPQGGVTAIGSSFLGNDPSVSPRMAYDGDPATSWLADPRDHTPTLVVDLGRRRTISRIRVAVPASLAAVPTEAVIKTGGHTRVVQLRLLSAQFAPMRGRRVTITFEHLDPLPRGAVTLGVGDVSLGPGTFTVALDGATRTGAVCGFGPRLVVDGQPVRTRVDGTIGSVVAGGQLAIRSCHGPLRLGPGEHRVRLESTRQFQPVALSLTSSHLADHPSSRTVRTVSTSATHTVVDVSAGDDAILSLPQSFNAGWTATVDGRTLDPLQVDGWSQGWRLPAGTSGEVVIDFAPQHVYRLTLLVGLGLLGLVLLAGLITAVGVRVRPAAAVPSEATSAHRGPPPPLRRVLRATALVVLAAAVGGPIVAAGAALGAVLVDRPRLARLGAAVLLLTGLVGLVVQVSAAPAFPAAWVDLVTGAGIALALASAALAPPPLPHEA